MDKVTHFLFLTALVLVIICCLMWVLAVSCTSGFLSDNKTIVDIKKNKFMNILSNMKK